MSDKGCWASDFRKEEGRRKKEEGRGKKEEGKFSLFSLFFLLSPPLPLPLSPPSLPPLSSPDRIAYKYGNHQYPRGSARLRIDGKDTNFPGSGLCPRLAVKSPLLATFDRSFGT
ncbi:MAG: hypothetical protein ACRC62_24090 [Microcoleus sp.]